MESMESMGNGDEGVDKEREKREGKRGTLTSPSPEPLGVYSRGK